MSPIFTAAYNGLAAPTELNVDCCDRTSTKSGHDTDPFTRPPAVQTATRSGCAMPSGVQNNVRTAISVGQASGLALVAAARAGVPVVQYSPNEIKLAVTGDGRADKAAVQMMVTRLLGLAEIPQPADAADALALACCHMWRAPLRAQVSP